MASVTFHFGTFMLDPTDRRLSQAGRAVELNARYFDALTLLVTHAGSLVSKDHFLREVWRGIPVTDEALTQCVKTLRRQLGDDAAAPRFIETVPKHGYRFVAPVETRAIHGHAPRGVSDNTGRSWPDVLSIGAAGTVGAAMAGVLGGLGYGLLGAAPGSSATLGALSVLLVLSALTLAVALLGGGGVSFGIAVATRADDRLWRSVLGGAGGGMLIGAIVKLLGIDAFNLLFGHAPGDFTGAPEGAALGAAVGLGSWLAARSGDATRGSAVAALIGAVTGLAITLSGGNLMGGSLALLASDFPGSRLGMTGLGAMFGEQAFGHASVLATSAAEGALFAVGVVGGLTLARRRRP